MARVDWPDEVDGILGGDLTAAAAYVTPAGGSVVTAVAPVGLRDRDAGIVTFTTSLGLGKKLERIRSDPRVALAYHARVHGFSDNPGYVLVQGRATIEEEPDADYLEGVLAPQAERFMGPRKSGRFWDRWLREYYRERIPVHVQVERIAVWPDLRCKGTPAVHGAALPAAPDAQKTPKSPGPRVNCERAAKRLRALPHVLLAYRGGDGFPVVQPVGVAGAVAGGIRLEATGEPLPAGGRRAGIVAHSYRPQLIGLASRQHTGWLEPDEGGRSATYAPHTEQGFKAPANKTLLLLANGLLAKRGLRKARRAA